MLPFHWEVAQNEIVFFNMSSNTFSAARVRYLLVDGRPSLTRFIVICSHHFIVILQFAHLHCDKSTNTKNNLGSLNNNEKIQRPQLYIILKLHGICFLSNNWRVEFISEKKIYLLFYHLLLCTAKFNLTIKLFPVSVPVLVFAKRIQMVIFILVHDRDLTVVVLETQ